MSDRTITVDWVCGEGSAPAMVDALKREGAESGPPVQFEPDPDELDLYADPQFEPMVAVAITLAVPLFIRQFRSLVMDLRGREVAMMDFTEDPPQVRRVPIGAAKRIYVRHGQGVDQFDADDMENFEKRVREILQLGQKQG